MFETNFFIDKITEGIYNHYVNGDTVCASAMSLGFSGTIFINFTGQYKNVTSTLKISITHAYIMAIKEILSYFDATNFFDIEYNEQDEKEIFYQSKLTLVLKDEYKGKEKELLGYCRIKGLIK